MVNRLAALCLEGYQELLLRETTLDGATDLQLVVSLLALQSRKAEHPAAQAALWEATVRVAVLARARADPDRATRPAP